MPVPSAHTLCCPALLRAITLRTGAIVPCWCFSACRMSSSLRQPAPRALPTASYGRQCPIDNRQPAAACPTRACIDHGADFRALGQVPLWLFQVAATPRAHEVAVHGPQSWAPGCPAGRTRPARELAWTPKRFGGDRAWTRGERASSVAQPAWPCAGHRPIAAMRAMHRFCEIDEKSPFTILMIYIP